MYTEVEDVDADETVRSSKTMYHFPCNLHVAAMYQTRRRR
jgi:hypothetical protein